MQRPPRSHGHGFYRILPRMNLPNQLTVARLGLTIVFVVLAYSGMPWAFSAAAIVFGIASFTDYLDGRIARERNLITAFGKLMDPLADKVLMAAAFVVLMDDRCGTLPGWLVIAILSREFLVTGLRLVASAQGAVLSADRLGKQKTVWQMITASYLLLLRASAEAPFAWCAPLFKAPLLDTRWAVPILLAITGVTTIWSGFAYFWKNRSLVMRDC